MNYVKDNAYPLSLAAPSMSASSSAAAGAGAAAASTSAGVPKAGTTVSMSGRKNKKANRKGPSA